MDNEIKPERKQQIVAMAEEEANIEASNLEIHNIRNHGWRRKILNGVLIGEHYFQSKEEAKCYHRALINAFEKITGMNHPGRKKKTKEERQDVANEAHRRYMEIKKDKRKGRHLQICKEVANDKYLQYKTVERDWRNLFPEDW